MQCLMYETFSPSSFQSNVLYIDYGNKEVVQNSEIVELRPSLANSEAMAKRFVLHGLNTLYKDAREIGFEEVCI